MMIRYLSLLVLAIGMTVAPCRAEGPGSPFRDAYACSHRGGPSSVCVYGKIPAGKQVTLLAKGWKSAAVPKETFSNANEEFQNREKTSTRLQSAAPPPKDAIMIAILTDAKEINELPLREVQDEAVVKKISRYIRSTDALNLDPDIRILKTRLLRLSPTVLLSESFVASPNDEPALRKQLPKGCDSCEIVPLWVGQDLVDLFKSGRSTKTNSVEHTCGGIKLAFTLSERTYLLSHALTCESDAYSETFVHDLSGPTPKLVFNLAGGL
jgi:hypothetical protein